MLPFHSCPSENKDKGILKLAHAQICPNYVQFNTLYALHKIYRLEIISLLV